MYDAYNPEARDIYWKYLNDGIFKLGMDAWWMDSTEPDHFHPIPEDFDTPTVFGSFRKSTQCLPLMSVGGVYDHQRAVTSDKRVFILTRSALPASNVMVPIHGQEISQHHGKFWRSKYLRDLNFSLCGIPHWNSDIGGFFLWQYPLMLDDPDYRELYARWIQFGTFCPMMRSHGEGAPRESINRQKGEPIYDAIEKYIRLRYSLLPYIYTTAWEVTANQSSFMRALAMDFAHDRNVWNIHNQYMFGNPIVCLYQPMYTNTFGTTTPCRRFQYR